MEIAELVGNLLGKTHLVSRNDHSHPLLFKFAHGKKDFIDKDWIESGTWEVELAWKRYPAKVQFQSFYDPKGERIKA